MTSTLIYSGARKMVKIFIGNITDGGNQDDLKGMFEKYGPVSECSILTNFGFVVSTGCM